MASCVDKHGVAVEVERPLEVGDEIVERARDMIACRLSRRGLSQRIIGRILGVSEAAISKRFDRMPKEARDRYERDGIGALAWMD
jgi:DNA-directed RNA polymerase specialized sigma subunit